MAAVGAAGPSTELSSSIVLAVPSDYLLDGSGRSKCMEMVDRQAGSSRRVCYSVLGQLCYAKGQCQHQEQTAHPNQGEIKPACPVWRLPAPAPCRASQYNVKRLQFVPTLFWVDEGVALALLPRLAQNRPPPLASCAILMPR